MAQNRVRHLFPGSNTCAGFMGFFDHLHRQSPRTVILKGGPGVGKSTLMARAGAHFEQKGLDVTYYHCSGDPDSLDAVCVPSAGFLVLDGTAPHVVDPALPGARDSLLNLGVCLNEKQLREQAHEIEDCTHAVSACFAQAYRYLRAAQAVRADAAAVYDAAFSAKERRSLEQQLLALLPAGPEGDGAHAFAQAITWKGVCQQVDSILTDTIYCLNAPWGFDVNALLLPLWSQAAQRSATRAAYHDPLDAGALSHIAVGNVLFTTASLLDAPAFAPQFSSQVLQKEQQRLAFDKAVYDLTLNQAVDALAEAKRRHDTLERYYIDAMDYDRLEEIKQSFLAQLP